jgi:predicted enzyme related to lactoylglutathione lyase
MPGDPRPLIHDNGSGEGSHRIGSAPSPRGPLHPHGPEHCRGGNVEDAASRVIRAGGEIVLGPIDSAPAGRLVAVRDPTGAAFCLWEAKERQGARHVNEPSAWAMSMPQMNDQARAVAFYRELFGWLPEALPMQAAEMSLWRLRGHVGGATAAGSPRRSLGPAADRPRPTSQWTVNFWIDDANAAATKTLGLGGQVLVAPHDIPGFWQAVLKDPPGAAFSVNQFENVNSRPMPACTGQTTPGNTSLGGPASQPFLSGTRHDLSSDRSLLHPDGCVDAAR